MQRARPATLRNARKQLPWENRRVPIIAFSTAAALRAGKLSVGHKCSPREGTTLPRLRLRKLFSIAQHYYIEGMLLAHPAKRARTHGGEPFHPLVIMEYCGFPSREHAKFEATMAAAVTAGLRLAIFHS